VSRREYVPAGWRGGICDRLGRFGVLLPLVSRRRAAHNYGVLLQRMVEVDAAARGKDGRR
jgi:hypothetical protein